MGEKADGSGAVAGGSLGTVEPKSVLFVGLTQNGKSRLIKSMLSYGGRDDLADRVSIGRGNLSETSSCAAYELSMPMRRHRLVTAHNESGRDVDVKLGEDDINYNKVANPRDLREVTEPAEGALALRLIDTPGMGDSRNMRQQEARLEARRQQQQRQGGGRESAPAPAPMAAVLDERNKLGILAKLGELQYLHAVCFVVHRDTPYGNDLVQAARCVLGLLGELLAPAERADSSGRDGRKGVAFFVVHTYFMEPNRLGDECATRRIDFGTQVTAAVPAEHVFVNSVPEAGNEVESYLWHRAVAAMLRRIAQLPAVRVGGLSYPKSTQNLLHERGLVRALESYQAWLRNEASAFDHEISSLQDRVAAEEAVEDEWWVKCQEAEHKISELDTDALIEVSSIEATTGRNIAFGLGSQPFEFDVPWEIASVYKSCSHYGKFKHEHRDGGRYRVDLEAAWLEKAHGTVTISCRKREVHAEEIAELRTKADAFRQNWLAYSNRREEAERALKLVADRQTEERAAAEMMGQKSAAIQGGGAAYSVGEFQGRLKFFAADSVFAAACGHGLMHDPKVSPSSIPALKKMSMKSMRRDLGQQVPKRKKERKQEVEGGEDDAKARKEAAMKAAAVKAATQNLEANFGGDAMWFSVFAALLSERDKGTRRPAWARCAKTWRRPW